MADSVTEPVPGWDDDAMRHTLEAYSDSALDSDLSDEDGFFVRVARLFERRIAPNPAAETIPAVFLMRAGPPDDASAQVVHRPLLNNGTTELGGHVWFVDPVVIAAHGLLLDEWDDSGVFEFVKTELDLGSIVAAIVDPRPTPMQVRLYRKGLARENEATEATVGQAGVSLAAILDRVDVAYKENIRTPGDVNSVWEDSEKGYPSSHAEGRVQHDLKVGLSTAFPTAKIRKEQPSGVGRLDLIVEESRIPADGTVVRHAVLELKVLRERSDTGGKVTKAYTNAAVRKGVKQAAAYRQEMSARAAALCCFDTRDEVVGTKCFRDAAAVRLAQAYKVTLRNWHLFRSAEAFRSFEIVE